MNPLSNAFMLLTGFMLGNKSGREAVNRGLEWANEKSKELFVLEKDKDKKDQEDVSDRKII